jgi:cytochrome c oxidase subunit IV
MSQTAGNPYRIYRITWVVLLIITMAMLAAEMFHLPRWFLIVFLVCFMMVKAVMIAGNFMHLRFERPSLAVVVASGILVTSLILFSFISREAHHVARSLSN